MFLSLFIVWTFFSISSKITKELSLNKDIIDASWENYINESDIYINLGLGEKITFDNPDWNNILFTKKNWGPVLLNNSVKSNNDFSSSSWTIEIINLWSQTSIEIEKWDIIYNNFYYTKWKKIGDNYINIEKWYKKD